MSPAALADAAARRRALTERGASLWVEAGAGSGKTALMAGRVVLLLADGVPPHQVAAITFTERAAAELAARIHDLATALLGGEVPVQVRDALPDGLDADRRAALEAGVARLDDLTTTTIHGFAYDLIRPYPVEANVDPGAVPMDEAEAKLAFEDALDAWLRDRLDEPPRDGALDASGSAPAGAGADPDDPVAALALEGPGKVLKLIHDLAEATDAGHAADRPDPRPEPVVRAARAFFVAADAYLDRIAAFGGPPDGTTRDRHDALRDLCAGLRAVAERPTRLAARIACDRDGPAFTGRDLYKRGVVKKDLEAAAAARGLAKKVGAAAYQDGKQAWEEACAAFAELDRASADLLQAALLRAIDDLRSRYADAKRASARLDFNDLLAHAVRLLRTRPDVRDAAADRYRHLLVDEFQDTDPLQAEIVWRLTGDPTGAEADAPDAWTRWPARGAARFVVGDPKQSIYRFRRADVRTYTDLRTLHDEAGLPRLSVVTNFRSRPGILGAVSDALAEPLSAEDQPGYEPLVPYHGPDGDRPSVVRLRLPVPDGTEPGASPKADAVRDTEARAVARLCARLIRGDVPAAGGTVPAKEIALLAPVGTDLWRYERELEAHGVAVASQAGKGLYGRQEVHDLVALARALADPNDRLAFGALLRGPLVGATDEELLDIVQALRDAEPDPDRDPDRPPRLTLRTDPELVPHAGARRVLERLGPLQRDALGRTPYATLAAAVDRLEIRARVRERHGGDAARALANVERFLNAARPWAVRGLGAFARDQYEMWKEEDRALEGRPDAEEDAVTLITVHSAKGLQWRVVVPVNTLCDPDAPKPPFTDRATGRLAHRIGAATPSGYDDLAAVEARETDAERVRLLYVAATRAADLLVVPRPDWAVSEKSWLAASRLHETAAPTLDPPDTPALDPPGFEARAQDPDTFATEAERIRAATPRIVWTAPSRHDAAPDHDARVATDPPFDDDAVDDAPPAAPEEGATPATGSDEAEGPDDTGDADDPDEPLGKGRVRGLILHALMEALITGQAGPDDLPAYARAAGDALLSSIRDGSEPAPADTAPDPEEIAAVARAAWTAPELDDVRDALLAELPVYGRDGDASDAAYVAGVADAVAPTADGRPDVVIDWKSDVDPTSETEAAYRAQVLDYLRITGAREGRIVYATRGRVEVVVDA